jgi:hypothetical protein
MLIRHREPHKVDQLKFLFLIFWTGVSFCLQKCNMKEEGKKKNRG